MWQLLKFCEKRRTAHIIWFSLKRRLHPPSVQYWSDTVWNKTLCAPSPAEFLPLFLHMTVLNCLFSFYIFFYPIWQSVDTRTHLRMLELWTILISPGLTDWDIPQVYLVLYFLFPFMLTEDSDVFVVYFFLCRLSVWCLFFCYQWPKSCSPFIHTWQMWVVCLSMCRVPEFFFANILLISSLNVLIIIVYMWRMLGKERAATLYSLWLHCIVVFFFIIVNHCLNENLYSHVIDVWPWWMQKITFHICVFMCMCVCLCVW